MSKMIVYNINKKWILDKQDSFIDAMHRDERDSYLVSLYNYMFRKCSLNQIKTKISVGDICYCDFGDAYQYEIGYQHLGVVISIVKQKLFVVPIISEKHNDLLYTQFRFPKESTSCLKNDSIALLNDSKWISKSRVIRIIGNINTGDEYFKQLKYSVIQIIL